MKKLRFQVIENECHLITNWNPDETLCGEIVGDEKILEYQLTVVTCKECCKVIQYTRRAHYKKPV